MPHTTPIIPESQPNDRKNSTLNETMKAARANANTTYGAGIVANSTASGNSVGVDSDIEDRSFWAALTRRLRYFSAPPMSYLRIPNNQKPKERTSVYDVVEYFTGPPDGLYLGAKAKEGSGPPYYRNPWESYDGFTYEGIPGIHDMHPLQTAAGDGCWDEDHEYLTYGSPGYDKNHIYFKAKETRYVQMGGSKMSSRWIKPRIEPTETVLIEKFTPYCPQYFWSYGWCELKEDFDINRSFSPIFNFIPRNPVMIGGSSGTTSFRREPLPKEINPGLIIDLRTGLPDTELNGEGTPSYASPKCNHNNVPQQFMSHGGLYGSAMGLPAYEVNNCTTLVGQVVRMHKGKGDYYLFNNTNCPQEGGEGWPDDFDSAPYHFWRDIYGDFQNADAPWY
jgi:hypothetical protein